MIAPLPPLTLARLANLSTLHRAWDAVAQRSNAAGVDGVTTKRFSLDAADQLRLIAIELADGTWTPTPARRIRLEDAAERPIALSTVRDRVVQRAVGDLLCEAFAGSTPWNVHGFVPGRGVASAVELVSRELGLGRRWVLRTDIEKFFDRIERPRLASQLAEAGADDGFLGAVARLLDAGAVVGAHICDTGLGVAQGSACSPMLSNVYLRDVDASVNVAGFSMIRYADDLIVLGETPEEVADAQALLERELARLGLRLNASKSRRLHAGAGFRFLGWRFDASGRGLHRKTWEAYATATRVHDEDVWRIAAEHRVWFGELAPAQIDDADVLAAEAALAGREGDLERLVALAARRHIVGESTVAALAAEAARAWWRGPDDVLTACAADIVSAVRRGVGGAALRGLALTLGVSPTALQAAHAGPLELAAAARDEGLHALATAAEALVQIAEEPPPDLPGASDEAVDIDADAFARLFRWHPRRYTVERRDAEGRWGFRCERRGLPDDVLGDHFAGGPRVGVYPVLEDGRVAFAAMHVRVRRTAALPPWTEANHDGRERWRMLEGMAHDHAVALQRAATVESLPTALEREGDGSRAVWLFFRAPVLARHAAAAVRRIIDRTSAPSAELHVWAVPCSDSMQRAPGPFAALPLGAYRRTGAFGRFIDAGGRVLDPNAVVAATLGEAPAELPLRGSVGMADGAPRVGSPRAKEVLAGCAVLRALSAKGARLGVLDPIEKRTLLETFGHLPKQDRLQTLHELLHGVGARPNETRRALQKLPEAPLGCQKVRGRHARIADEVGCACAFVGIGGPVYPTPVLHTLAPSEIPSFRRGPGGKGGKQGPRPGGGQGPGAPRDGSGSAPRRDDARPLPPPEAPAVAPPGDAAPGGAERQMVTPPGAPRNAPHADPHGSPAADATGASAAQPHIPPALETALAGLLDDAAVRAWLAARLGGSG